EPDRYNRPGDRWAIHINPDGGVPVVTPPNRTRRFTGPETPSRQLDVAAATRQPFRARHGP
ncbi:MAG: hypothetical protein ACOH1W_10130, partial [Tessaracoccus sp.]